MRIKKLSVLLLAVFLAASSAHAADFGQELFDFFVRKMDPEKAELHLQSLPTEKGEIPWAYLECVNANVRGMNIQSLKMDCFDAVITPPEQWKKVERIVEGVSRDNVPERNNSWRIGSVSAALVFFINGKDLDLEIRNVKITPVL